MRKRVVLWILRDVVPVIGNFKAMGREEPGAKSVRMMNLRQKALWVASGNGDGRDEKPRCDVPQGVVSKTGTRLS